MTPKPLNIAPGEFVDTRYRRVERGWDGQRERLFLIVECDGDGEFEYPLRGPVVEEQLASLRPKDGELIRIARDSEPKTTKRGTEFYPEEVSCPERKRETVNLWTAEPDVAIEPVEAPAEATDAGGTSDVPF